MTDANLQKLLLMLEESLSNMDFIKLTLSSKKDPMAVLKNLYVKVVAIKAGNRLSMVYRYPTKDVTKNFTFPEGVDVIKEALQNDFFQAIMITSEKELHYMQFPNGKSALKVKASAELMKPVFVHDKQKKRYVTAENNVYLHLLGVTTTEGKVKKGMEDKFRQINKYVEVVSHVVEQANLPENFSIADMGSGKGYLTFALYDYLTNAMNLKPKVVGVELRPDLVKQCNSIAQKSGLQQLSFVQGSIEKSETGAIDMLIALHACDTATDEAIYRGISQKAGVIITAPCCHKQVRKQMNPPNVLSEITKFGILEERQAEILTDTIRALMLEAYGYQTRVFEFISTEHTPKNVLIVAVKRDGAPTIDQTKIQRIAELKALFGIQQHHLETLLNS